VVLIIPKKEGRCGCEYLKESSKLFQLCKIYSAGRIKMLTLVRFCVIALSTH